MSPKDRLLPSYLTRYFEDAKKDTFHEVDERKGWHNVSVEETFKLNQTSLDGLTEDSVEERRKEFGKNVLPTKKPPSIIEVFLRQFLSPLIYVLVAAGVIAGLLGDLKDSIFISIVLLINAVIGTFQEMKAEKSAEQLQKLLKTMVRVRRDGHEAIIPAEDLVPGDVVLLESGAKVPADLRLVQVQNLSVDESLLTGESLPVAKAVPELPEDLAVPERVNMAFAGTTVSQGRGVGVVVQTGGRTEIGQIAKAVTMVDDSKPPLVIRLEKFSKQISYIILLAALAMGIMAFLRGMPIIDVFFLAVALAVAAIPEGLPVAVTVAMAIRVTRMAKRNVLTRRLAAVESLGSCTCIASDKTGTLTVNKQTAKLICIGQEDRIAVSGEGYAGEGSLSMEGGGEVRPELKGHLEELVRAVVICNEASLRKDDGEWTYTGDSVDVALLALGYKMGLDVSGLRSSLRYLGEVPFESEKRFAAKFYERDGRPYVAVKGGVEAVLQFCTDMMCGGVLRPVDKDMVEKEASYLSEGGYRTIAVASGYVSSDGPMGEEAIKGLTFLGVVGLIDPPRPEVKDAVERCHRAGVNVVMVTGDHPSTAFAIAKELGIAEDRSQVVTGKELAEIGSPTVPLFLEKVKEAKVFARVTPVQKLEIVDSLIKLGNYVAVTGDGVNDAPALRKANIGVAMGSGTDVAKDASSIIVTDDNFSSIVAGVEEGRYAYENVRKVTYLLVSTGMAEITLFILALIFGAMDESTGKFIIPLIAVQLLWLNVVTNGIQHVTLAMEAGDPSVMERPPRNPNEGIFDKLMIRQVGISAVTMGVLAFLVFYYFSEIKDYGAFQASNLTLLLMVLLENVHVLNCRSERRSVFQVPIRNNYYLILGIIGAQGLHLLAMYTPVLQDVLRVEPVDFGTWAMMLGIALVLLGVMEVHKLMLRRSEAKAKEDK
ncbi:MAG: HAD-IC family P-type ATPase [Methanomassiliicoccales archaeon]|nr:MAG: HAD-IC family P-type ATPase [Methanomassiliicoccales archaeon]